MNTGNFALAVCAAFGADNKPTLKAIEGFRVCNLRFKTPKSKDGMSVVKRENFSVAVPLLNYELYTSKKQNEFVQALVNDFQDSMAKEVAEGELEASKLDTFESLVEYFNDNSRDSSGRKFTKESIGEWFEEAIAETVVKLAQSKNAQATAETLANIAMAYKEMFSKATAYNLPYNQNQLILITRVLEEAKAQGETADWFKTRISKFQGYFTQTENELENAI